MTDHWLKKTIPFLVTVSLTGTDQAAKLWAVRNLAGQPSREIIPGLIGLTYVENRGMAFGMLEGGRIFFLLFYLAAMVLLTVFYFRTPSLRRLPQLLWRTGILFTAAGASGNAADRLFRSYVIDMIELRFMEFPVFNLADCFVVCGCTVLCLLVLTEDGKESG